jgi:hypothetical protein
MSQQPAVDQTGLIPVRFYLGKFFIAQHSSCLLLERTISRCEQKDLRVMLAGA